MNSLNPKIKMAAIAQGGGSQLLLRLLASCSEYKKYIYLTNHYFQKKIHNYNMTILKNEEMVIPEQKELELQHILFRF